MRSKRLIPLMLLVLCAFALAGFVPVHAQVNDYDFTVNPAYVPITVTVNFVYSQNISIPIGTSVGNQSVWNLGQQGNRVVVFSSGDVDTFRWSFTVNYPLEVAQTVEIDEIQGSLKVERIDHISVSGSSFTMSFTVISSVEPSFPSAQDILSLMQGQMPSRSDILNWQQLLNDQEAENRANITDQWIAIGVLGALFTVVNLVPAVRRKSDDKPRS